MSATLMAALMALTLRLALALFTAALITTFALEFCHFTVFRHTRQDPLLVCLITCPLSVFFFAF